MNTHDFQDFTERLTASLAEDSRVSGLVACGSMAALERRDAFSDHDFFVIVNSGTQSEFRQDLSWLPDVKRVVCAYLETEHGMKAIYDDGHILEFAVFDREELRLAKVNDYAVLVDKGSIAEILEEIFVASGQTGESRPDVYYYGQLFAHLIIGVGRYMRGERLSAHVFVKQYGLDDVIPLLTKYGESPRKAQLDNLSMHRRFDFVFPEVARDLEILLLLDVPHAALRLLDVVEEYLRQMPDFPDQALQVTREYIERLVQNADEFSGKVDI